MSFSYDEWMRKGWQREPTNPYKEACEFIRQQELAYKEMCELLRQQELAYKEMCVCEFLRQCDELTHAYICARKYVQSYKKEIEVALFGYDGFCEDGIVQIIVNYLV